MKFLIAIIGLVYVHAGWAQRYSFQTFSTAEGLSQSQVTALCQDSEGYLWVGTLGGVSRYNGNTFRNFSSENGLLNNRVSSLFYRNEEIWVGHDGGVSVISGDQIRSMTLGTNLKTTSVSKILAYKGQVVIALNGGGLFRAEQGKLKEIKGLEGDHLYIRDLHIWGDKLYLATRSGILCTSDLRKFQLCIPELTYSMSGIDDDGQQLLFSSFSRGLFYYNPTSRTLKNREFSQTDFRIDNILVDSKRTIWLSTQSTGIIKITGNKTEYLTVETGLPINTVSTVYEDSDGSIWVGTLGKGVAKAPNGDLCYFDKTTGLESDLVISGFQDQSGACYFGTLDVGVVRMTPDKQFETIPLEFNNTVWAAQKNVDGYHWFGTRASLVAMDDKRKTHVYSIEDGTPGYKITCFYKTGPRSMYVGGNNGVVLYNNGRFSEIADNRQDIGTARSMQIVDKVLYVATDMGLYYLMGRKFLMVNDFSKTVFSLARHNDGALYFGTEDGLFRLKSGKMERVRFASEVASNFINFLNSNNGQLIVGTNNGVFILEGEDLISDLNVTHIGLNEGLIDLETNLNSSFFDDQGNFWFGTSAGLVRFNPVKYSQKGYRTVLRLSEILLNYEHFNYADYGGQLNRNGMPENMVFPYNRNNLQFNLDGIALSQFDNLKFQYWLEGLEEGWSPPTSNMSASFSGLPAGEYRFHARILNLYGELKDEVSIAFIVRPAFYKTWWFILLMATAAITAVVMLFRARLRREREKSENERVAFKARLVSLEQQSLNASMNRHFIFNSLNSIQYFINTSDKLSANKYLTNFAKLIRKNLDSSAEENSMVPLSQEIERIELYLSLEAMRFKDRFTYRIDTHHVDTESYTIPAMMIQPFVENSIIHGVLPNADKLGEISLDVYEEDDYLCIRVQDNGIGIDESLSHKDGFSGDHKSQGMEITFKRIDLIRKVSDQKLEVVGPMQINGSDGSIKGTVVLLKIRIENLE